jgi:hypothetical protein
MDGTKLTEEHFLKDVSNHKITIVKEDGIYRHVSADNPKTFNQWFEIITWPGCLAYHGDMGSFMFQRCDDMFALFRGKGVSPGYLAEKVTAENIHGGIREFSVEEFRDSVLSEVRSQFDVDEDGEISEELMDELHCLLHAEDEWECVVAMRDFSSKKIDFCDFWEHSCMRGTWHYIWACFAINWAVNEYDKIKKEVE